MPDASAPNTPAEIMVVSFSSSETGCSTHEVPGIELIRATRGGDERRDSSVSRERSSNIASIDACCNQHRRE
jgi:hypothetical protein